MCFNHFRKVGATTSHVQNAQPILKSPERDKELEEHHLDMKILPKHSAPVHTFYGLFLCKPTTLIHKNAPTSQNRGKVLCQASLVSHHAVESNGMFGSHSETLIEFPVIPTHAHDKIPSFIRKLYRYLEPHISWAKLHKRTVQRLCVSPHRPLTMNTRK